MKPNGSNRFSFTGYHAPTWLAKNKEGLKLILVAVAAVGAYFVAKIQPPELNAVLAGVVGAVVKFIVDAVDYWLSEVPA